MVLTLPRINAVVLPLFCHYSGSPLRSSSFVPQASRPCQFGADHEGLTLRRHELVLSTPTAKLRSTANIWLRSPGPRFRAAADTLPGGRSTRRDQKKVTSSRVGMGHTSSALGDAGVRAGHTEPSYPGLQTRLSESSRRCLLLDESFR